MAENGGLVYDGYLDVARRFLISAHDDPVHPFGRAPPQRPHATTVPLAAKP